MNWISVNDRLPEEEEDVLIYARIGSHFYGVKDIRQFGIFIASHTLKDGIRKNIPTWKTNCACYDKQNVSNWLEALFWMPLPKNPEVVDAPRT